MNHPLCWIRLSSEETNCPGSATYAYCGHLASDLPTCTNPPMGMQGLCTLARQTTGAKTTTSEATE